MILFSLGPFGPFSAWLDAAVVRIAETGFGPSAAVYADGPDELAVNLIRSTAPHLVVLSRRAAPPLRALLADTSAPMLIGVDDPWEGLFDLVVRQGHDLRMATQVLSDCCTAAMVCAGMAKALVIDANTARSRTADVLGQIAQFCGVSVAPGEAGIAAPPAPSAEAKEWWGTLAPDQRALAEGALRGYETWLAGRGVGEITWDRRLFLCAADDTRTAGMAIEIGDTPGLLVHGPWIGLPPGHWAASVTLAVSREVNGARFDIAIHPGPLATGSIICDGRGLGSATLLFTIEPTAGETISVGVTSTAPAPGGRLALGNVVLTPGPSESAGIPIELSSALSL